jgi:F0F1-type ATP synthase beta subunit
MLETSTKTGFITQIIGPVVDAVFPSGDLPKIYNAINLNLKVKRLFVKFNNY